MILVLVSWWVQWAQLNFNDPVVRALVQIHAVQRPSVRAECCVQQALCVSCWAETRHFNHCLWRFPHFWLLWKQSHIWRRWLKKGLFSVPVARNRSLTAATNGLDGSKWCLKQGQRSSFSLSGKMSSIAFANYDNFIVVSFWKTSLGLRNRFNLSKLQIFSPLSSHCFLMTLKLHRSAVFKYNMWQQLRGWSYFLESTLFLNMILDWRWHCSQPFFSPIFTRVESKPLHWVTKCSIFTVTL